LPAAPPAAPTRPAPVEKAVSEENEADPAKQALPSSPPDVRSTPPDVQSTRPADVQSTPPSDVRSTPPSDVRSPSPDSTFAAGSLEDLMRQEVDKEQRVHKR
jgi:hypothetical protein